MMLTGSSSPAVRIVAGGRQCDPRLLAVGPALIPAERQTTDYLAPLLKMAFAKSDFGRTVHNAHHKEWRQWSPDIVRSEHNLSLGACGRPLVPLPLAT
jgi:hypothetical protein